MNSNTFSHILGQLNPTLNFQSGEVSKFPIIFSKEEIDDKSKNNREISKKDWDSRETSWDFEKSSLLNESVSITQAYQTWQEQVSNDFFQLHANEEELNRIFIDIYGLQEELSPEVALKDITVLQEELDNGQLSIVNDQLITNYKKYLEEKEINNSPLSVHHYVELPIKRDVVISQFISYLIGVMLGRYRLDKPGLNIAHPNATEQELAPYTLTINHSQFPIHNYY